MTMVIDLLTETRKSLQDQVAFMKGELVEHQNALIDLQSESFIERNKDHSCWTEKWTINDYIRVNVKSRERSIKQYLKEIDTKTEYISQIDAVLDILKAKKGE